jgi:hypothetical protein
VVIRKSVVLVEIVVRTFYRHRLGSTAAGDEIHNATTREAFVVVNVSGDNDDLRFYVWRCGFEEVT